MRHYLLLPIWLLCICLQTKALEPDSVCVTNVSLGYDNYEVIEGAPLLKNVVLSFTLPFHSDSIAGFEVFWAGDLMPAIHGFESSMIEEEYDDSVRIRLKLYDCYYDEMITCNVITRPDFQKHLISPFILSDYLSDQTLLQVITGITSKNIQKKKDGYFNLAGQKIIVSSGSLRLPRGVYIKDGRILVVR